MFGYIKSFKPELKMIDYEIYRAMYCGLCKQLGRAYGPFARLTLSYDFAFMALLELSCSEEELCLKQQSCAANPFIRKNCCCSNQALVHSADAAMIMLHYKLRDTLEDSSFFGRLPVYALYPFSALARRRAKKHHPQMDELIGRNMESQRRLELEGCDNVDQACEPSADSLSKICETLSENPAQKRILNRLGFFLGRWVYLIDAADDFEQDLKSGSYNMLRYRYPSLTDPKEARQKLEPSLNMTLGEIANAFNLLDIRRFHGILENILYLGLPQVQRDVLNGIPSGRRKRARMLTISGNGVLKDAPGTGPE